MPEVRRRPPIVRRVRDRRAGTDGSVIVEFALIVPVMLVLILATFEISKFVQTNNQVVQVASITGQMISQLPGQAMVREVQRIWSAAPLIAPEAQRLARRRNAASWDEVLDVTITSVVFRKTESECSTACEYKANVAWSVGRSPRSCGELTMTKSDGTVGEVPAELVREGSALLVQTSLPYEPSMAGDGGLVSGIVRQLDTRISETGWFQPRNSSRIVVAGPAGSSPDHRLCPEFNR